MDNSGLVERILHIKKQKNAIILAHNYQRGEVQDIADYTGDSLGLSRVASQTDADVIVFCGVHFMAETASILCPDKKVLMPDINAGCPMADMISAEGLRVLKKAHKGAVVVGYVNTSAKVKAEVDICCTSANAVDIVRSINHGEEIIFVPDKYLCNYVAEKINRSVIPWNGYCPSHVKILPQDILQRKKANPNAEVIVHPECTPPVIGLADKVLSTEGMCRYSKETNASEIIVGTEVGILHRLRKENPDKQFYPASERAVCPNMKLTTLEKILWVMKEMKYEIKVPETIQVKAKRAVDKMLDIRSDLSLPKK